MLDVHVTGPRGKKACFPDLRTTKVQTSLRNSLISDFVIHVSESVISRHATSEISIF